MIYSTSTKYAVMALIELAKRPGDRAEPVRHISITIGIPYPFLAKIIQLLVKAGMLSSSKGRGGGLKFSRHPSQLPIIDIVRAIDGQQALQNCIFDLHFCDGNKNCPLHPLWGPIRDQIVNFLRNTTIADLARKSMSVQSNLSMENN